MLAVLTIIILGGTQALNGYFLSPFSIKSILSFFSILTILSCAQLVTVLVGAIDLSIGPLAGLCVVLASFLAPDGVLGGTIRGRIDPDLDVHDRLWLVAGASDHLAAPAGDRGDHRDFHRTARRLAVAAAGRCRHNRRRYFRRRAVSIWFLPACVVLTLAIVGGAEWLLYRTAFGRNFRAVGSSPLASHRLGIDSRRLTWLAFVISGFLTGVGGLMLAGQVGIGSPSTGTDYTLMSITVVVLGGASVAGGRGSFVSTTLGAALVQATSSASSYIDANSSVHYTVIGMLTLLAAILFSLARRPSQAARPQSNSIEFGSWSRFFHLSVIFSKNRFPPQIRFPPRIKSGAAFSGSWPRISAISAPLRGGGS